MRLIDTVFRQGHLAEQALIDAIVAGERPRHLDQCDICAERAVQLARWLDDVQTDAADLSDAVFTPERLVAQQQQILRRLEQIDQPSRVIAFPAAPRPETQSLRGRRVGVSWVGVAAAAGLVLGVVGGQITARLDRPIAQPTAVTAANDQNALPAETSGDPVNDAVLLDSYDTISISSLDAVDAITPRMMKAKR